MANQEHIELLKQGTDAWNVWRKEHLGVQPDLSNADLANAELTGTDLHNTLLNHASLKSARLVRANLRGTDLTMADLREANLEYAILAEIQANYASFTGANLANAYLSAAYLSRANFSRANLTGVDLSDSILLGTIFSRTNLNGTDFGYARIGDAIFTWVDLSTARQLNKVVVTNPFSIDITTVKLPRGQDLIWFLGGTTITDTLIGYLPSLLNTPIRYQSCFISYAHQDEALARCLYKDLQDKGVQCWFAPHDLKIGDKFHTRIDEAIHLQEKLLLLISEYALQSDWVEREVVTALEREQRQKCDVLFPVRLDESVMRTSQTWAADLRRRRHIGDFTNWQDDAIYQQRFEELLRHLKAKTT